MRRLALAAAVALGCNNEGPGGFSTGPSVTSVADTTTSSGGSSSSTSSGSTPTPSGRAEDSAASGTSTTTSGTFDMGPPPDFDTGQPAGCQGKIDFMFLISAQGNMHYFQDRLLASVPGFLETIDTKFADFDTHILSVNV